MLRREPPVRLDPVIYDAWLGESPKVIEGGQLELVRYPLYSDEDAVKLDARRVSSEILPSHYANTLFISGYYDEYEGFKVYVKPGGFDYLLMAHQTHSGPFRATDGRRFEDHPHFHELDFDHRIDGTPGTRRIVPPTLGAGINSAALLEAFLNHYYFDDGRSNEIEMPRREGLQTGLGEFYE